jgi:hypothetical protein
MTDGTEYLRAAGIARLTGVSIRTAARLIAPASDWRWLGLLKARLASWGKPLDRFGRLVPPGTHSTSVSR